jgi:ABC-type phosphate transport system substrate-binding protein
MRSSSLLRAYRRAAAALIGTGLLTIAAAPAAQAEFTPPYTTQCSGGQAPAITTGLASQIQIESGYGFEEDIYSPLACAGRGPSVSYTIGTSAEALTAFGASNGERNPEYVFAGNEEPPTLAQWLLIDLGDKPGANSGLIRQIPVASTAVVPLVHFPEGCSIPAEQATGDGRFVVSNAELEKVYAGEVATWGQLLPDIESHCASIPLKRVVPGASDGPTYVFKQWLALINSSRGWSSLANTSWPNDSGATATVRSENGDRGEARLVAETNGSIGFSSLPNARTEGFGVFAPGNPKYDGLGLFWLSVEDNGKRVEPTKDRHSGENNVLGANCYEPEFNYVPSGYDTTVTPIWRYVTAVGSKTGWPICTLVYDLAWDDASTVYGDTEVEQARQRTVKDFLGFVLGQPGQEEAEALDYSPLTPALLADAQEGLGHVGWDKLSGSKASIEKAIKAEIVAAEKHTK